MSETAVADRPAKKKARARANGEGSLFKTKDGRWRGIADLDRQDGKRRRKYVSGATRNEALAALHDAYRAASQGVETDGRMTVGKWLDHWLETVVEDRVGSHSTRKKYEQMVRVHLTPALGKVRLDKLSSQVDRILKSKADAGLGRSHVGRMRTVLADALKHAERRGLVARNAAALSVMPKTTVPTERHSLTQDEARPCWRRPKVSASKR